MSGNWKKLEVIDGGETMKGPAYIVEGRNLVILLSNTMCDVYPEYSGVLSDAGFVGRHHMDHMMGSEEYGKVYGMPVRVDH